MPRPKVKDHVPYFTASGAVHFRHSGELTSFDDPDGRVSALLGLLDGTRGVDEVFRDLRAAYPDVTADDVAEALRELDDERLIHDATDGGDDFTAAERERWARNIGFFESYASLDVSTYEFQRRIRDAKVALLGVGGVGSHALIDMVAIGFTDIRVVDFDTVELSNLNRQILYGEEDVGRSKVLVAAERARALNSGIRLDVVEEKITSGQVAYELVSDRDIVVAAADRPRATIVHWINEGCMRAGAAVVTGGVDGHRAFFYSAVPGSSGCFECWYANVRQNDETSSMVLDEIEGPQSRGYTVKDGDPAFNGLVALLEAHMVGELVRLATGVAPAISVGRVLEMTFADPGTKQVEAWTRRPDCPVCAGAAARPAVRWTTREPEPAHH